jgi:hypothetical protein
MPRVPTPTRRPDRHRPSTAPPSSPSGASGVPSSLAPVNPVFRELSSHQLQIAERPGGTLPGVTAAEPARPLTA